jgi:hypothetical protein
VTQSTRSHVENNFEDKILEAVDSLIPLSSFSGKISPKQTLPASI